MTIDEAIKELEEDRALYALVLYEGTPDWRLIIALDMAIEALRKQEEKQQKHGEDG